MRQLRRRAVAEYLDPVFPFYAVITMTEILQSSYRLSGGPSSFLGRSGGMCRRLPPPVLAGKCLPATTTKMVATRCAAHPEAFRLGSSAVAVRDTCGLRRAQPDCVCIVNRLFVGLRLAKKM